jgi:hypothetical protein
MTEAAPLIRTRVGAEPARTPLSSRPGPIRPVRLDDPDMSRPDRGPPTERPPLTKATKRARTRRRPATAVPVGAGQANGRRAHPAAVGVSS